MFINSLPWPLFHNISEMFSQSNSYLPTLEDSINETANDFECKFFVWNPIHDAKPSLYLARVVDALLGYYNRTTQRKPLFHAWKSLVNSKLRALCRKSLESSTLSEVTKCSVAIMGVRHFVVTEWRFYCLDSRLSGLHTRGYIPT